MADSFCAQLAGLSRQADETVMIQGILAEARADCLFLKVLFLTSGQTQL